MSFLHAFYFINKLIIKLLLQFKWFVLLALVGLTVYSVFNYQQIIKLTDSESKLRTQLEEVHKELEDLKNQDQYKINQELKKEVDNIHRTYQLAVSVYEKLIDFQGDEKKREKYEDQFAKSLKLLSDKNYQEAEKLINELTKSIDEENQKVTASFKIPENVPQSNNPPSSGFSAQRVSIDAGDFLVSIISADLNSTRVIVDTASESDCSDNCPVLSLSEYVSRNNAFAGVNGSYFCPAAYPSCAGKTNSFDTLLMNKNKKYFNSDNNVYSKLPAVIFSGSSARFVAQSLEWGRDTSVDAVIANYPLLTSNNQVAVTESSDPKLQSRGGRSFVGATGATVYIGVVHNATVAQAAKVLNKLGIQNSLNLDDGGSTALWFGGYKAGPGRNLPNVLLFAKK